MNHMRRGQDVLAVFRKARDMLADPSRHLIGGYMRNAAGSSCGPRDAVRYDLNAALTIAGQYRVPGTTRLICELLAGTGYSNLTSLNDEQGHAGVTAFLDNAITTLERTYASQTAVSC